MAWFNQRSASDAASPYLNKIEQNIGGQNTGESLGRNFNEMANDPTALIEKLMAKYNESPAYQAKRDKALSGAYNAAAYGGNVGGAGHQEASAELINSLMGEDMQQWLQNALGIQNAGLQGQQGQNSELNNLYGTQAQLAYTGQNQKNQNRNDIIKSLLGGAGAAFGGPIGSAIGSGIGSLFGGGSNGNMYGDYGSQQDYSNPFGHSWNARG